MTLLECLEAGDNEGPGRGSRRTRASSQSSTRDLNVVLNSSVNIGDMFLITFPLFFIICSYFPLFGGEDTWDHPSFASSDQWHQICVSPSILSPFLFPPNLDRHPPPPRARFLRLINDRGEGTFCNTFVDVDIWGMRSPLTPHRTVRLRPILRNLRNPSILSVVYVCRVYHRTYIIAIGAMRPLPPRTVRADKKSSASIVAM